MSSDFKLLEPPADAEESCYIETPVGVTAVLRRLASSGSRAAVFGEDAERCMHTVLLGVEPGSVVFAESGIEALNQQLLRSPQVTFVTSDQGIPVQFSGPTPVRCKHDRRAAFAMKLPKRVLRLQRRNYYRLPGEPVSGGLKCELTCDGGRVLKPSVIDLSCGGLGAALPGTEPRLERDQQALCRFELPGLGWIRTAVRVRAVAEMTLPDDVIVRRYGLEFLDLPSRAAALLERYIFEQQRLRIKVAYL